MNHNKAASAKTQPLVESGEEPTETESLTVGCEFTFVKTILIKPKKTMATKLFY
jgi:hypothetical protein